MPLFMDSIKRRWPDRRNDRESTKRDLAFKRSTGCSTCVLVQPEVGRIYCLVHAPSKDAANAVHREAHGLIADELVEVWEGD